MYPSKEQRVIESLKKYMNFTPGGKFPLDIGDDAALRICKKGEKLVFTMDASIEEVHFSFDYMTTEEVGFRAMVRNVSDCAAMGAKPDFALVQMIVPQNEKNIEGPLKGIYRGIRQACRKWDFPVTGGDISAGPCWAVCVSMAGKAGKRAVTRGGAKPGDLVWVTGNPGSSIAGFNAIKEWGRNYTHRKYPFFERAHIKPRADMDFSLKLAADKNVHALIDISDGTAKELISLSNESGVKIEIDILRADIRKEMADLAEKLGRDPLGWYLSGGEDYELVFCASPSFCPSVKKRKKLRCIGKCVEKGTGLTVYNVNGERVEVKNSGWDHLM